MILKTLRIQNYKSILDSEEFSVSDLTCLVGKNESGKTAILQALYKLNPAVPEHRNFNPVEEYPRSEWSEYKERHNSEPANVLTSVWELSDKDAEEVAKVVGPRGLKDLQVVATKGYDNIINWDVHIDERAVVAFLVERAAENAELDQAELASLKDSSSVDELIQRSRQTPNPSSRLCTFLKKLEDAFPEGDPVEAIARVLDSRLPTFLYFCEYNKLPGQVSLEQLKSRQSNNQLTEADRTFLALLGLAGTSLDDISRVGRFEELIAELEAVSNRISRGIFEYWSQNRHLEVQFRLDAARPNDPPPYNSGNILRTRIRNNRHKVTVGFDERSSGFVWFFSFLVCFSQICLRYGSSLFILLDEPGLSLHAKAQADLLRYINEKLQPHYQVMYTTHSPFAVDPEHLERVRTVEDVTANDEILGTKIGDRVLSTDAETLFPLQAALGYEITQSLFVGKHMLLVEGPSDLVYLKWFSNELKARNRTHLDQRWVITPTGGIDKISSFMALFSGSKLNVAVLTDFQEGAKRKVRELKESTLLKKGHVVSAEMYADQAEADVEDLLGRDLYVALVNKTFSLLGNQALPPDRPAGAPIRVVKEVEEFFRMLPPGVPDFDHYAPAVFLLEHGAEFKNEPSLESALERFERLFRFR